MTEEQKGQKAQELYANQEQLTKLLRRTERHAQRANADLAMNGGSDETLRDLISHQYAIREQIEANRAQLAELGY